LKKLRIRNYTNTILYSFLLFFTLCAAALLVYSIKENNGSLLLLSLFLFVTIFLFVYGSYSRHTSIVIDGSKLVVKNMLFFNQKVALKEIDSMTTKHLRIASRYIDVYGPHLIIKSKKNEEIVISLNMISLQNTEKMIKFIHEERPNVKCNKIVKEVQRDGIMKHVNEFSNRLGSYK